MTTTANRPATEQELQELVKEADLGGRDPQGLVAKIILIVAVAWSVFQVWYASPLPFVFGVFILNDTEARAIHLGFSVFLAFTCYPAFKRSPRRYIPIADWVFAIAGAFAASYLFLFYRDLALRPGQPTWYDLVASGVGLLLLLEATRRSLGPPMVIVAAVFITFTFAGPWMPDVIQHKGASLTKFLQHQWLTTEGVFGVALGVSAGFVFLFVLFGSLLEKAGGGNWMMQISVALLGHLRGGPAKVAVVSSALNGVVSGSSVSNVVSGGIFTIPMMKRTGLSGVKAGAIETASSVNGQIMPPVMGAAAFLMTEYVGLPYSDIVKHAFLPAVISYIALFYIVDIEAQIINAKPLERAIKRPRGEFWLRQLLGWSGTVAFICGLYYVVLGIQAVFGVAAPWLLAIGGIGLYLVSLWYAARFPDLELDDASNPDLKIPEAWAVARTGLHFTLPIIVLLWCLMVEEMSPGLSAFWATASVMAIVVTQRPIIAFFRGSREFSATVKQGLLDLVDGLNLGARNMIGIGIATATAGIIVGTVTLTGMGLMMTDFVEFLSGGNVMIMLFLTAFICLILGMGIPTTANYILVATLMAPVIVELGAQAGLAIPLIAVHMFVFYFGIMADVTPPVGLASFAAAAISGEDPIKTGLQGTIYSMRTAVLPFVFIFNPQLLLIDIDHAAEAVLVIGISTIAILLFAAGTMGWFLTRSKLWESALLLLICFAMFRPGFFMDKLYEPYVQAPAAQIYDIAGRLPDDGRILLVVAGTTLEGEDVTKTISLPVGLPGDGRKRLADAGLTLVPMGDKMQIGAIKFGSGAKRVGLEGGFTVEHVLLPADRPSKHLVYIPAFILLAGIVMLQLRRRKTAKLAVA
ncbi:TRAP transporter fused permease subunit [Ferrovibrio terrae]|uniref:TRAP transporter fused permease subunit n=1 Tax=Ferrovibrio terrae TaxID=2594003 RepID=A0A516GXP3_9PROT|nr:TRAP transporter permease [Ferrovibrio terrae]QDO96272.1 TRAP transporter fused permease subunit [Ferrovibrio terrae]